MKNEAAFGLYSYSSAHPCDAGFRAFCEEALLLLNKVGLRPTYFAAEGEGHRGEAVPMNGGSHKRSMAKGFENSSVISLICNPEGSGEPAFDSFAEISLSFLGSTNETLLSFSVDADLFEIESSKFNLVLNHFLGWRRWEFGYAISTQEVKNPSFYVLAADDGKLSQSEMDELLLWYNSEPTVRVSKIRSVHPINFINEAQLTAVGKMGGTLQAVIEADNTSTLMKISDDLWQWNVPPASVGRLKGMLAGSGLTICGG